MGTEPPLLSVAESAEFLGVSKATVYRLLHMGTLERWSTGPNKKHWKIPRRSLEIYKLTHKTSLEDVARRVVQLEDKLNELLAQRQTVDDEPEESITESTNVEMQRQMRKRHPELFN